MKLNVLQKWFGFPKHYIFLLLFGFSSNLELFNLPRIEIILKLQNLINSSLDKKRSFLIMIISQNLHLLGILKEKFTLLWQKIYTIISIRTVVFNQKFESKMFGNTAIIDWLYDFNFPQIKINDLCNTQAFLIIKVYFHLRVFKLMTQQFN